ncbi:MAG: hypothetical protein KDD61_15415 [Bdellovibrionales bacterium]|nr:hypothetical protein [Bdellovibrionales bacterium]
MTDTDQETNDIPQSIEELVLLQRKFLHDVASPLMIAMGMTDSAISQLTGEDQEKLKMRLEKAKVALQRIALMIKENRSTLHTMGDVHGKK